MDFIFRFLLTTMALALATAFISERKLAQYLNNSQSISKPQTGDLLEARPSRYQVTEDVIDVPDNRPLPGPVIRNYSLHRPINIANKPNNNPNTHNISGDNHNNRLNNTNSGNNKKGDNDLKSNKFSILHINGEFDEKPEKSDNCYAIFSGIKNYLNGLKKGIINGITGWFNKNPNVENFV